MSDSEDDMFPNNVFTFQNENTLSTISAQGRGINKSNLTGFSFRSNVLTSTLNMPGSIHHQRLGNPQYDQRSLYNGRETSPMSMRSDFGPRTFHNSYYPRAMSSQRSLINGRSGSPMSVRSIDTTASVSAIDIANAFKYMKFNNQELRIIKDAYNKLMRNKVRKRIEKRRNLKLFLRGVRRKSGYDSGEQGSDSSISSDDCRSVKTTMSLKSALPRQHLNHLDKSLLRTSIKETDIYTDCTDIIKQNSLRNVFPVPAKSANTKKQSELENCKEIPQEMDTQNATMTLKDRFTKGFLLPSQRFNKSNANMSVDKLKNNGKVLPTAVKSTVGENGTQNINVQIESEEEQIFPEKSIRVNGTLNGDIHRKRYLDEDSSTAERKKTKVDTSLGVHGKHNNEIYSDFDDNDFPFKKPSMPIRKSNKAQKEDVQEKLISRSSQPLTKNNHFYDVQPPTLEELDSENNNQTVISQTSDVSMKPSFIKRKLFTQKLDLLDNKNLSSDNLAAPSPVAKSNSCKEKNKTRKLVTSQSCLNRDVLDDENNVLDLIHKIIPADQMNLTSASNKHTNKSSNNTEDKWDVASVVSLCNSADGSDTYTDEEIFNLHNNTVKNKNDNKKIEVNKPPVSKPVTKDCKVVLTNVSHNKIDATKESIMEASKIQINKGAVSNSVKSFWDTDLESDMEGHSVPAWKQKASVNQVKETLNNAPNNTLKPEKKKGIGSILPVRGLQNKINNNNKTIINDVKKPPISTTKKKEVPKVLESVKTKVETTKKTQKQTKKLNKSKENILNTTTRSTRNSKKNQDCTCCDNLSNTSTNYNSKVSKAAKPLKSVKLKTNTQSPPKEPKKRGRKKKVEQAALNNTQDSESSINISSRSLRSMRRLENSKENIEPKRTRSWCKNTSLGS